MSDSFEVPVANSSILRDASPVVNISQQIADLDRYPVIVGSDVVYFHDITGGYDPDSNEYIISLVHTVQGIGSPPDNPRSSRVEVHTSNRYYMFDVTDIDYYDDEYPNSAYQMVIHADNYRSGPFSFQEALTTDIDRRETEYSPNGDRQ